MELTGDVLKLETNMKITWKIKDFSSLSQEANLYYSSPKFHFSGASWQLIVFPNGHTEDKSNGYISLYLKRMSSGTVVTMNVSFNVIISDEVLPEFPSTLFLTEKDYVGGFPEFLSRRCFMLTGRPDSKTFVVSCTLTHFEPSNIEGSLLTRRQERCGNLRESCSKCKSVDCTLKVDARLSPSDRFILQSLSPVLAAKFALDMKEIETGEISMDDMDKCTMKSILMNMYTGDIENPTKESVLRLYEAANKYSIEYVRQICVDFVEKNLSINWLFDVIKFNVFFQDKHLDRSVKQCFYENVPEILDTEKWIIFSKENPHLSIELLSNVVRRDSLKRFSLPSNCSSIHKRICN